MNKTVTDIGWYKPTRLERYKLKYDFFEGFRMAKNVAKKCFKINKIKTILGVSYILILSTIITMIYIVTFPFAFLNHWVRDWR